MVTASWIAASASSRRPSAPSRVDRLFSDAVGAGRGQLPVDLGGHLAGGQRVLPPSQAGQPIRQVVQRGGQVGAERVGAERGQLPVDLGGLLAGGQRVLPPSQAGQPIRQVVQRGGQVGAERVGAERGQLPV